MGWFRRCSRGAVVGKEQFLERRLAAEQMMYTGCREHAEQRLDRPDDLTANPVALYLDGRDTRNLGQVGRGGVELGIDRQRGEVAHLGQAADLDKLALAQNADPIAQRLDFAEDV